MELIMSMQSPTIDGHPGAAPLSALRQTGPNVTGAERVASLAGGAALAGWGVKRGGIAGATALVAGAALLARGALRRDPVKRLAAPRPAAKQIAQAEGWSAAAFTTKAVTINRPREEVYAAWRDFEKLGRILENIERIDVLDDRRSHWVARGPGEERVEWDAEITEDEPGRRIAWRSIEGADVANTGVLEFHDGTGGRGCVISATLAYEPPGGAAGRLVAAIFQREPVMQARRDLKRFKQMLETGEIATTEPPHAAPRAM